MPFEPGRVFDQYRLDQTIHRGRATVVYAATDVDLGRRVAFKVLGERYASDPAVRQRFVREAQIAASLDSHPHIVTVYSWGEAEGSMYFVTELIDGISLTELLERQPGGRPLPPSEALVLLQEVADALDFAHQRGAIHRDVKPSNVMVKMTETPRSAYLVDFGITKTADAETDAHGLFLGTPDYASPEQISGVEALDRRADVYSLACTTFETLVGRPPFGDAPNDAARITAHLHSPIPSAHALRPDLPPEVDRILAKALAKDREDRHTSCGELMRELRAVFPEDTHVFLRPPPPSAELPPPALLPDEPPRRKWPWVMLGVVALAIAAVVVFFLTEGRRNPEITRALGGGVTTSTTTTTTTTAPTTTTTTTVPRTTTTAPGPFGVILDEVASPRTQPETYAVALGDRRVVAGLSPPMSAAMIYAEWLRLLGGGGDQPILRLGGDGLLAIADEPVALTDFQVEEGGRVLDFRECRESHQRQGCPFVSSLIERVPDCDPGPGCASVASTSGATVAHLRVAVDLRPPAQNLLYELVSDRPITGVSEPTGAVSWDPGSQFMLVHFGAVPPENTTLTLTISYADGESDELLMTFNPT